mmetsp:Transcript_40605/g.100340  ORF Transcript_40605/g.100340 Transcript_40605/m.100340 type:complete len:922 (-) Transcript_40605:60-2825(-)
MVRTLAAILVAAATMTAHLVAADIYMHNPRGGNDRNCERNVNRNNGNRLFDSQNNAKGGYACPRAVGGPGVQTNKLYYYAGSAVPIEWTAQHGCGDNPKEKCNMVIQYACEDTLDPAGAFRGGAKTNSAGNPRPDLVHIGAPRDGTPRDENDAATDTIPTARDQGIANTVETRRFGMHENSDYYAACTARARNAGLFTADQNVRRRDARGTRQNPNGNRNGLECPEERDYYPYWAPNPWIDVAVLHDYGDGNAAETAMWCDWFKAQSQNSNSSTVGECIEVAGAATPAGGRTAAQMKQRGEWYNAAATCTAAGHNWITNRFGLGAGADVSGLGLTELDCQALPSSRVNQLGNSDGSVYSAAAGGAAAMNESIPHRTNANRYVWQVPPHANKNCVLRVRYNISTGDYAAYTKPIGTAAVSPGMDYRNNSDNSPVKQDPYVVISDTTGSPGGTKDIVSLALNTNQYGRTFQDRSFVFEIRAPLAPGAAAPAGTGDSAAQIEADRAAGATQAAGGMIYNLNVRGKRGNIVQTYPAVEYDFVPNDLNVRTNDVVHFQWTGSDYNPRRGCNDAEGGPPDPNTASAANQNSRADRSNIVALAADNRNMPLSIEKVDPTATMFTKVTAGGAQAPDMDTAMMLAYLGQHEALAAQNSACLTQEELENINNKNERENHPRNCAKLNAAFTPYFDAGPVAMNSMGRFPYFSSRNNNFSNRDHTGVICVDSASNTGEHMCAKEYVPAAAPGGAPTIPTTPTGDAATVIQLPGDAVDETAPVLDAGQDVLVTGPNENDAEGDGDMFPCEETVFSLGTVRGEVALGLAVGMLFLGAFLLFLVEFCCARVAAHKQGRETVGFLDFIINAVSWRGYAVLSEGKSKTAAKPSKPGRQNRSPSRTGGTSGAAEAPAATPSVTRPPVRQPRTVVPPPSK